MAESKPTETKNESKTESKQPTEVKQDEAKQEGVTLYRADGREKVVTSPAVQTQLEFSGWSRDKSVFESKDDKKKK